jgi:membrane-associated protein
MMNILQNIIEFIFHIDKHLSVVIQNFGAWSYLLLFAIIFAETGFVVTPFLPGDSLLFAAGTFAAVGAFKISWLFTTLVIAAIAGDSINYAIGKIIGDKIFKDNHSRFFKKEYLERTHRFYEKYGGKTIVLARFVPIIRTFAPFVAGVGRMNYFYFLIYNITGGLLWVGLFTLGGFYFGNIPFIKNNFSLVILVIIFLSILPAIFEFYKHKLAKSKPAAKILE